MDLAQSGIAYNVSAHLSLLSAFISIWSEVKTAICTLSVLSDVDIS